MPAKSASPNIFSTDLFNRTSQMIEHRIMNFCGASSFYAFQKWTSLKEIHYFLRVNHQKSTLLFLWQKRFAPPKLGIRSKTNSSLDFIDIFMCIMYFFFQYYLRTGFNILTLLIWNSNKAKLWLWFHAVQYPTAPALSMLCVNTHFNILYFFRFFSLYFVPTRFLYAIVLVYVWDC